MPLLLGLVVIVLAVYAIARRVDVRLALFLAALALGALAGNLTSILRAFLVTFADEKFVVPICCAMGFAHVLRHTGCDQHLVRTLTQPLQKVNFLLIPGAVLVGFLVNVPIISQASTAVTVGSVLIPLLLAARLSPVTVGAALLLGASVGGELLNPGAPEMRTIAEKTQEAADDLGVTVTAPAGQDCVRHNLPLALVQLTVATLAFWVISLRAEARTKQEPQPQPKEAEPAEPAFCINYFKAMVPLVPLVLLFLTSGAFKLLDVPQEWLVAAPRKSEGQPDPADQAARFESRLIGAAMLLGAAVAALTAWRRSSEVARAFCEGAGYAFANIITVIVAASCFGEGVKQIGLAALTQEVLRIAPGLLLPLAGLLPFAFALLSGSGMASTQSLFGFFAAPALLQHADPAHVGGVVSLAAAAGRTMSPVAAVVLLTATLTKTNPVDLVRRVSVPLLLGVTAMVVAAMVLGGGR
jgi:DcuC family C4-dicarboxylate transporter